VCECVCLIKDASQLVFIKGQNRKEQY